MDIDHMEGLFLNYLNWRTQGKACKLYFKKDLSEVDDYIKLNAALLATAVEAMCRDNAPEDPGAEPSNKACFSLLGIAANTGEFLPSYMHPDVGWIIKISQTPAIAEQLDGIKDMVSIEDIPERLNKGETFAWNVFGYAMALVYYDVTQRMILEEDEQKSMRLEVEKVRNEWADQYRSPKEYSLEFVKELREYLDKFIVGQEQAKNAVTAAAYEYLARGKTVRTPVLLIGPTGCGKTFILHKLRDFLVEKGEKVSFASLNVSHITGSAWKGMDIEDALSNIFKRPMKPDVPYIAHFDEFDKMIAPDYDSRGQDISRSATEQFMNVLSGEDTIGGIRWGDVLIFCTGSFAFLDKTRKEISMKSKSIGFGAEASNVQEYSIRELIAKAGVSREMIGRIPLIVELKPLDRLQLKQILIRKIRKQCAVFRKDNLYLVIDDVAIDAMLAKVESLGLGARSCDAVVADEIGLENIVDMAMGGWNTLHVTAKGKEWEWTEPGEKDPSGIRLTKSGKRPKKVKGIGPR